MMQKVHFRPTSVAQKRCCLSSLLSLQPPFDHFFREDKLTSDSVETSLILLPCNELKGRHVPHVSVVI